MGKSRELGRSGFGLRACPNFGLDILQSFRRVRSSDNEEGVVLDFLHATKDLDAGTILAASKKPTQIHPAQACWSRSARRNRIRLVRVYDEERCKAPKRYPARDKRRGRALADTF